VERYGGLVWAVARAHGLGPGDAGDVSQVTWLLLTQHLGSPNSLSGWCSVPQERYMNVRRRLAGRSDLA
jgi:hypothetical protein